MKKTFIGLFSALGMLLLILDSKTAILGARDGVKLCLQSVIPALFPFIFLSSILCKSILGTRISILRPLGKLLGIPEGAESLLLLGFLGGYPVGAQNIRYAVDTGAIDKKAGQRMLGFCNNAGPAFIFGMAGSLFENSYAPWLLWFVHILSAVIVGAILPNKIETAYKMPQKVQTGILDNFEKSIRIMGNICGWVVVFRMVIAFCKRWFLWLFPLEIQVIFSGLLELTNGIISLLAIQSQGMRFLLCGAMLSLGGLCVAMQTMFVSGNLRCVYYFPGKILQCVFSVLLSLPLQHLLFSQSDTIAFNGYIWTSILIIFALLLLTLSRYKNNSRNLAPGLV